MEKFESYLKVAEDSISAVQTMSNSLKFNNRQCRYLAKNLKVADLVLFRSLFLYKT
jgi:hypothetical protein